MNVSENFDQNSLLSPRLDSKTKTVHIEECADTCASSCEFCVIMHCGISGKVCCTGLRKEGTDSFEAVELCKGLMQRVPGPRFDNCTCSQVCTGNNSFWSCLLLLPT